MTRGVLPATSRDVTRPSRTGAAGSLRAPAPGGALDARAPPTREQRACSRAPNTAAAALCLPSPRGRAGKTASRRRGRCPAPACRSSPRGRPPGRRGQTSRRTPCARGSSFRRTRSRSWWPRPWARGACADGGSACPPLGGGGQGSGGRTARPGPSAGPETRRTAPSARVGQTRSDPTHAPVLQGREPAAGLRQLPGQWEKCLTRCVAWEEDFRGD